APGPTGGAAGSTEPTNGGASPEAPSGAGNEPALPAGSGGPEGPVETPGGEGPDETPGEMEPAVVYPAPVEPWQPSQACLDRAEEVLAGLTLRQKAGQMVQGNSDSLTPADVASYQLGSAFSGGSADP